MSTFEQQNIEVPQKSRLHLLTGSIVLSFGSIGGLYFFVWLLLV